MNKEDIVWYRWVEMPKDTNKSDVIRLPFIRLQMASYRNGVPYFNSAVPVLMGDGKHPRIVLCAGPVYRVTDPSRQGKLIAGRRTDEEKNISVPVEYLYSGVADTSSWALPIHRDMVSNVSSAGAFNFPLWCRKAKTRKDLTPRDNMAVREDLGISQREHISAIRLKRVWDNMADNAGCIGYCPDGFLWEAGMIKRGGVVCIPRQYDSELNISGVCLKSDMQHIIKTHRWKNIKL